MRPRSWGWEAFTSHLDRSHTSCRTKICYKIIEMALMIFLLLPELGLELSAEALCMPSVSADDYLCLHAEPPGLSRHWGEPRQQGWRPRKQLAPWRTERSSPSFQSPAPVHPSAKGSTSWRVAGLKEVGSSQCPWGTSPQQQQRARTACSEAVQARLVPAGSFC